MRKHKPETELDQRLRKIMDAISNFYMIDLTNDYKREIEALDLIVEKIADRLSHEI